MSFVFSMLWYDRQRYFASFLAVAFSAILITIQYGLMLGMFALVSIPIDRSRADLWVTGPNVLGLDLGEPLPERYLLRLASQPEIEQAEPFIAAYAYWAKPHGEGSDLCIIIGSTLQPDSLGTSPEITPELRLRLGEFGTVVIDASDCEKLGVREIGETAEIEGHRVRVVGIVQGLPSLTAPYVFCSLRTGRWLLSMLPEQMTYALGKCQDPETRANVLERLTGYRDMSVLTRQEFSERSRGHWRSKTKVGVALHITAILGLLVGAIVVNQTLYAATVASLRELAVLRALGISRWRMRITVLQQSFWIAIIGVVFAIPVIFGCQWLLHSLGVPLALPWWLLVGSSGVTLAVAMASGMLALRALRQIEPTQLLR